MPRAIKVGLIASFLLLITVNVVMLDVMVFFGRTFKPSEIAASTVRITATPTPVEECSLPCEVKINALAQKVDRLRTADTTVGNSAVSPTNRNAKEYYIPLGSGTTQSNSWQELVGVEAVVDTTNYPPIKSVTFEVNLKIPTANGQVRAKLLNVTDKHDVWFSDVISEGSMLTKKEATVTLDPGAKTYRVMGLSTLKYDANIENARIKITTY